MLDKTQESLAALKDRQHSGHSRQTGPVLSALAAAIGSESSNVAT